MTRHVLTIADLGADGLAEVLALAQEKRPEAVLSGRGAALVFEHPSARTRNAAEMAVVQLGGHPVTIRGEEVGLDRRESTEDVARTLACYHALVGARVASHAKLERMAAALDAAEVEVPVVNLLSDYEHPTQALADLLTIEQCCSPLEGKTVSFIGDANNVCRSLVVACALVGANARVASPAGYGLAEADLAAVRLLGGSLEASLTPLEAADGADVIYTDVWVSMGEEEQAKDKRAAFSGFQIDEALMAKAAPDAIFLHCLPAHRGEEVSTGVLEGRQSRVFQQAENRMHAMRGLFAFVLGARAAD